MAACAKLPTIDKELNETREALRQIEERYYTLVRVIKERHDSERKVQHLFEEICNVILPEEYDEKPVLEKL